MCTARPVSIALAGKIEPIESRGVVLAVGVLLIVFEGDMAGVELTGVGLAGIGLAGIDGRLVGVLQPAMVIIIMEYAMKRVYFFITTPIQLVGSKEIASLLLEKFSIKLIRLNFKHKMINRVEFRRNRF